MGSMAFYADCLKTIFLNYNIPDFALLHNELTNFSLTLWLMWFLFMKFSISKCIISCFINFIILPL